MKKTILSLALVAMGVAAYAQKPAAGDKTLEFGLNFQTGGAPVNYGNSATLGIPELRFRYFMADDMAIRLKVGLGSTTNKSSEMNNIGGTDITAERTDKSGFGLALTPGIEKHFAGTDKLSPYVGAQLPIAFAGGASTEVTNSDGSAGIGSPTASGDSYKEVGGSRFMIGLGLVIGADYYFTDAVYLGVEGGLGLFNMTSTGEGTLDITSGGVAAPQVKTLKSSSTNLFGATSGAVRLGYKF